MAEAEFPVRWDDVVVPLATRRVGRPLWHYESVGSTMPLAHELAVGGGTDGAAILAEEQTVGRGRRGRAWVAPRGAAILCSIVCRPPIRPDELFLLTAAVGVGLCDGVERATGLRPQIKWPNDLTLAGGKLAGVLCESRVAGSVLSHAVVGFGLNVNLGVDDFPPRPAGALPPTSLALALGRPADRLAVLGAVLAGIDAAYDLLWQSRADELRREWRVRLAGIGEWVRVETDDGPRAGRFAGVADDGALLLEAGGETARILAGDVLLGPRPIPTN